MERTIKESTLQKEHENTSDFETKETHRSIGEIFELLSCDEVTKTEDVDKKIEDKSRMIFNLNPALKNIFEDTIQLAKFMKKMHKKFRMKDEMKGEKVERVEKIIKLVQSFIALVEELSNGIDMVINTDDEDHYHFTSNSKLIKNKTIDDDLHTTYDRENVETTKDGSVSVFSTCTFTKDSHSFRKSILRVGLLMSERIKDEVEYKINSNLALEPRTQELLKTLRELKDSGISIIETDEGTKIKRKRKIENRYDIAIVYGHGCDGWLKRHYDLPNSTSDEDLNSASHMDSDHERDPEKMIYGMPPGSEWEPFDSDDEGPSYLKRIVHLAKRTTLQISKTTEDPAVHMGRNGIKAVIEDAKNYNRTHFHNTAPSTIVEIQNSTFKIEEIDDGTKISLKIGQ